MANINELEWATVEGSEYPVAKTTIGKVEVEITKYDDDSYLISSGGKGHEFNLYQLDKMIVEDAITWTNELNNFQTTTQVIKVPTAQGNTSGIIKIDDITIDNTLEDDTLLKSQVSAKRLETRPEQIIPSNLSKWDNPNTWTSIEGVGSQVLEIPHMRNPGCTLRLIKLDEDSYKVAVIGLPPNDGHDIRYAEVNLRFAILNYSDAIGVNLGIAEDFFKSLK